MAWVKEAPWSFSFWGPLRVRTDSQWMEIGEGKPRALLGVLLASAGQVVSTDRLLEELWGDDQPSSGLKTLRYHVWKLREVLQADRGRADEGVIGTEAGDFNTAWRTDAPLTNEELIAEAEHVLQTADSPPWSRD